MARPWSKEETELLKRYDNATVAKITGRSLSAVRGRRKTIDGRCEHYMVAYKCYQCGKEFFPAMPEKWAYRRESGRVKMFCSWHCMRAYDGKQRQKKVAK